MLSEQYSSSPRKRKLVYVSPDYSGHIVPNNMEPIVYRVDKWLKHFFDVAYVNQDCSLRQVIDEHQPEMILFDSIIEGLHKLRLKIDDLNAYPEVPRAGLCRVDSLSPSRLVAFNYLESLNAEAVFVLGDTSMGEAFVERQDRIFYVPQFADSDLFHDYGITKNIPLLLVGNWDTPQYPWRAATREQLLAKYPCLYFRHPGYSLTEIKEGPCTVNGENYARAINASYIVPTSGGFKNIAITKHIEIPAARALLVTDRTPGVELLGFKHMEHCVYADVTDVTEAIDYLFENPSELARITDNGFRLAHERHLLQHRHQLSDWCKLKSEKRPGRKIIQTDPVGGLEAVPADSASLTRHVASASDWSLLREGDRKLWNGDLTGAYAIYHKAAHFCDYLAEPQLRIAIIKLLSGHAQEAYRIINNNIERNRCYGGEIRDPLDVAFLLIAYLCAADYLSAFSVADQMADFPRVEVDRARWAVFAALGRETHLFDLRKLEATRINEIPSTQQLRRLSIEEHFLMIGNMLKSCGQDTLAHNLAVLVEKRLYQPGQGYFKNTD